MKRTLTAVRRPLGAAAVLATAMLGTGAAVVPTYAAPVASAATGSADGSVHVTNSETVQVYVQPDGKLGMKHVYEQLVLTGHGRADVANPISTTGLRNLDGFSGVTVRDGKQLVDTTVDGEKALRTVSDYQGKLPLTLAISYTLDGKRVQPKDIVGKSGHLEVTYTVENVSGVPTQVTFDDGKGGKVTKTVDVPIPMVGTLSTDAPGAFRNVTSKQASMGGDGHGGTVMQFTLTLLPPIGPTKATFGYSADITDGVVPRAELTALPVDPLASPTFAGAASSYKGGADTGVQLTGGALQMDAGLLKLRGGASDLVAGLIKLHDGAGQLSDGLTKSAVPGANKLADGTNQLDTGGKKLSAGAAKLNGGLKQLKSKAPQLAGGVKQIADGQAKLAVGLTQLYDGVQGLPAAVSAQVNADPKFKLLTALLTGLVNGAKSSTATIKSVQSDIAALSGVTGLSSSDQQLVDAVINDGTGAQGLPSVLQQLSGTTAGIGLLQSQLPGMVDQIAAGIRDQLTAALGTPAKGCDPTKTLRCAAAALAAGGHKLDAAVPQLTKGVDQLAAGSQQLADGAGRLSDGLGQADTGAHQLASGLGDAADGASQIHDGLGTAVTGAPQIVDGAKQLSEQGSQKIAEAGQSTAQSYGQMYAELAAGAKRADTDAMAIGAPAGATALTAYDFVITGDDGQDGRNATRGMLAGGLLVVAAGGLLLRRRLG